MRAGAGESGKSTIVKQMKYACAFTAIALFIHTRDFLPLDTTQASAEFIALSERRLRVIGSSLTAGANSKQSARNWRAVKVRQTAAPVCSSADSSREDRVDSKE